MVHYQKVGAETRLTERAHYTASFLFLKLGYTFLSPLREAFIYTLQYEYTDIRGTICCSDKYIFIVNVVDEWQIQTNKTEEVSFVSS